MRPTTSPAPPPERLAPEGPAWLTPARTWAALLALALLVYAGALSARFTHWDDDVYITRNPLIASLGLDGVIRIFTTFSNCNYHPLTYLTWALEHAAVGLDPFLYHLDNVLLHAAVACLVFSLSERLLAHRAAAALTALLFLVHPLRVESVAWAAERKDVLCAFFYMASLVAWIDHLDGRAPAQSYALSLVALLAALLSKAMAITIPAVLVLLLLLRRRAGRRELLSTIPFWALGIVFALVGYLAQASFGAVKTAWGGGWLPHLLSVPKALAIYAGKLVVPWPLSPRYLVEPARGLGDPLAWAGLLLLSAGAAAALWSLRRGNRLLFFGLGFTLLTWAPVSGLVPTSTLVADRYFYLPALGLLWPLVAALLPGARRAAAGERSRETVLDTGSAPARAPLRAGARAPALASCAPLAFLLLLATFWGLLAHDRAFAWQDGVTLWSDALVENPRNPYAHNQLAVELLDRGRWRPAAERAAEAARLGLAEPAQLFNLCLAWRGAGEGKKELAAARAILEGAPGFLPARGVVLRHEREAGRLEECEREIARLLATYPGAPELLLARADLRSERGEDRAALADYAAVLAARPGDREALLGAGLALARLGDRERARRAARRARELPGPVPGPGERARLERLERELASAELPGGFKSRSGREENHSRVKARPTAGDSTSE